MEELSAQLVTLRVMLRQLCAERDALRENGQRLLETYSKTRAALHEAESAYKRVRARAELSDAAHSLTNALGRELAAIEILGRLYVAGDISAARASEVADELGMNASLRYDGWPGPPRLFSTDSPLTFPTGHDSFAGRASVEDDKK